MSSLACCLGTVHCAASPAAGITKWRNSAFDAATLWLYMVAPSRLHFALITQMDRVNALGEQQKRNRHINAAMDGSKLGDKAAHGSYGTAMRAMRVTVSKWSSPLLMTMRLTSNNMNACNRTPERCNLIDSRVDGTDCVHGLHVHIVHFGRGKSHPRLRGKQHNLQ